MSRAVFFKFAALALACSVSACFLGKGSSPIIDPDAAAYPLQEGSEYSGVSSTTGAALLAQLESEGTVAHLPESIISYLQGDPLLLDSEAQQVERVGPCYRVNKMYAMFEYLRDSYYLASQGDTCGGDNASARADAVDDTNLTVVVKIEDHVIYSTKYSDAEFKAWLGGLYAAERWWYGITILGEGDKQATVFDDTSGMKAFFNDVMYESIEIDEPLYKFDLEKDSLESLSADNILSYARNKKTEYEEALRAQQLAEQEIQQRQAQLQEELRQAEAERDEIQRNIDFQERYIRGSLWYIKGIFTDDKVLIVAANHTTGKATVQNVDTGEISEVYADRLISSEESTVNNFERVSKVLCALDAECRESYNK
jgi:hypothetical protein